MLRPVSVLSVLTEVLVCCLHLDLMCLMSCAADLKNCGAWGRFKLVFNGMVSSSVRWISVLPLTSGPLIRGYLLRLLCVFYFIGVASVLVSQPLNGLQKASQVWWGLRSNHVTSHNNGPEARSSAG